MIEIPLRTLPNFSEEITIEGTPYRFVFKWNERYSFWTMDILTARRLPIIRGKKLVTGFPLLTFNPRKELPDGDFFMVDTSQQNKEPNFSDFGTDFKLVYFSRSELLAF